MTSPLGPPSLAAVSSPPLAAVDGRVLPVDDEKLASGTEALFQYHLETGFFGDAFEGMHRVQGLGESGLLEAVVAPNRRWAPLAKSDEGSDACAMCSPPWPEERALRWRDFLVWPNAFPSVPAESRHLVIPTVDHVAQGYSASALAEMMDHQALSATDDATPSLHFNGIASNSQFHRHWQSTLETLPVTRGLDEGRLDRTLVEGDRHGKVSGFEDAYFRGFEIVGEKDYVLRETSRLVKHLEESRESQGLYNLMLVPVENGQRVLVVPRRPVAPTEGTGGRPQAPIGALQAGGLLLIKGAEVPEGYVDQVTRAAQEVLRSPADVLSELRSE